MKPSVPCRGCTDRELYCHSKCDDYRAYAEEMKRQRDLRASKIYEIDFHISEKGRLR